METIGFIGLGKMGGNIASRYLSAGYTVYGEARDRNAAQQLIEQGLRWVDTPREVAEAADVVMTSLPTDDVVESVAAGPDGLLAGLDEGKIWTRSEHHQPAGEPRARGASTRGGAWGQDARHARLRKRPPGSSRNAHDHGRRRRGRLPARSGRSCASWERRNTSARTVTDSCSSSPSTSASRCRCSLSPRACCSPNATGSIPTAQPR